MFIDGLYMAGVCNTSLQYAGLSNYILIIILVQTMILVYPLIPLILVQKQAQTYLTLKSKY